MDIKTADRQTHIPVLLRCGKPCGGPRERIATVEEIEDRYTFDPQRQRTVEPIDCKGATFDWLSTGKGDHSDRRRVD